MNNKCNAYDESKGNYVYCCYDNQKKEDNCPKPNRMLLKCGTRGGASVLGQIPGPTGPSGPSGLDVSAADLTLLPLLGLNDGTLNVASVNIDTSEFSHPCIKIEFACNIAISVFLLIDTVFTIKFQLFKQCGKQVVPIPVGSPWIYSPDRLNDGTQGLSDAFRFFVCDQTCKNECCNYFVNVTVTNSEINLFAGQININNATLTVTAVDGPCNC